MALNYSCYTFNELTKIQLYDIMRLRQEVFIVEQDCPYLDADGKDLESHHLIGTDEGGDIVAYTRLLAKGISYQDYCSIGRVVVSKKIRGTGAGLAIMQKSIGYCNLLFPSQQIKISAQTYLDKFYQNLGFTTTGDSYLEDNIPHQAMVYEDVKK